MSTQNAAVEALDQLARFQLDSDSSVSDNQTPGNLVRNNLVRKSMRNNRAVVEKFEEIILQPGKSPDWDRND
jgi:hypothetical protein